MGAIRTSSPQGSIRFGPFELRPLTGELRKNGIKLKISGQPLEILLVLIVRAGEVVGRDELRDSLWRSDTFVDFEHSLNAAIKRLRIALDDDVASPRYIETVPRRGYRFIGEIVECQESSDSKEPANAAVVPISAPPKQEKSEWKFRGSILLIAVLFLIVGILWSRMLTILTNR